MSLSPIAANTGAVGLTPPARELAGSDENVGAKLEGMFVSVLIKTMRQTIDGEGLFPGDSSDVLGGLFDQTMADHIAGNGGLGLAQFLGPAIQRDQSQRSSAGLPVDAAGTASGKINS